jgi:hypothetical protein
LIGFWSILRSQIWLQNPILPFWTRFSTFYVFLALFALFSGYFGLFFSIDARFEMGQMQIWKLRHILNFRAPFLTFLEKVTFWHFWRFWCFWHF